MIGLGCFFVGVVGWDARSPVGELNVLDVFGSKSCDLCDVVCAESF